jgi:hypothetical protein
MVLDAVLERTRRFNNTLQESNTACLKGLTREKGIVFGKS